jgi:hypothetical protein
VEIHPHHAQLNQKPHRAHSFNMLRQWGEGYVSSLAKPSHRLDAERMTGYGETGPKISALESAWYDPIRTLRTQT